MDQRPRHSRLQMSAGRYSTLTESADALRLDHLPGMMRPSVGLGLGHCYTSNHRAVDRVSPGQFSHNAAHFRAPCSFSSSPKTVINVIEPNFNDYAGVLSSDAFTVRPHTSDDELRDAARIRAEAYYEDRVFGRFTQSFIKQFADQEYNRLLTDVNVTTPSCIILVAIDSKDGACVGSLDLCLDAQSKLPADCVQEGVYIQNVAVAYDERGRGVGSHLVESAKQYAMDQGDLPVFAHVEATNVGAIRLYRKCGFVDKPTSSVQVDMVEQNETSLGRKLLLCCYPSRQVINKT